MTLRFRPTPYRHNDVKFSSGLVILAIIQIAETKRTEAQLAESTSCSRERASCSRKRARNANTSCCRAD